MTQQPADKKMDKTDHSSEETAEGSALKTAAEIAAERAAASKSESAGESAEKISQEELDELRSAAAKAQENWDRLLRLQADWDNYRKRATRERQDLIKTANEKLILDLLAPLDHFEMGLQSSQKSSPDDPLRQGMEMVLSQFRQFLKNQGVAEIDAQGQIFDPNLHEAVAHQESDLPEGHVIQQLRKGYRLHDKLLRPATVVVSKGKPAHSETSPSEASEEVRSTH